MNTIVSEFILWRVWLYLLHTIGEPGHSDALHLVEACQAAHSDEAFGEGIDGNQVAEQFATARILAHWPLYEVEA